MSDFVKKRKAKRKKAYRRPLPNEGEVQRQASVNIRPDDWAAFKAAAEAEGVSAAAKIGALLTRELTKEEPPADRAMLSMTAQQKFDLAVRQYLRKLDAEFDQRVTERHQKLLENIWPRLKQSEEHAERIIASRKGLMERRTYIRILARLHPDTGGDAELFDLFKQLETVLLNEKECPTPRVGLTKTATEWEERMRDKMRGKMQDAGP